MINDKTNEEAYIYKICSEKDILGMTWADVGEKLNEDLGYSYTPDKYRKDFYNYRNSKNEFDLIDADVEEAYNDLLFEIRKEKVKIADERAQINAKVRINAREETIKEIAHDLAKTLEPYPLDPIQPVIENDNGKYGILCLSDWHYGICIDNPWNKYDTEVCKNRVEQLRDKAISIVDKEGIEGLCVVNMGDLISGRIHTPIRINNRIDTITQVMEVSEMLAQLLSDLSEHTKIFYVSTSDNHSRIEPAKNDSLELESLYRITDWFLKERCSKFVTFLNNIFGDDIATFTVNGYEVVAVHGNKDKKSKLITNMRLMTGINFDIALGAHDHHWSGDELCGTTLIGNGSLMGCDQYSADLRLRSTPSQNFIICTKENPTECIYKINLK